MRKNNKPVFISTAIPYVNAAPHIGHAIEFIQADIIARHRRSIGDDVFFLSGTDDNALKNVLKAEEAGQGVASFVERNATVFQELLAELNISNDDFLRTSSDPRHAPGAQKLWRSFKPKDIEKKTYHGLYCVGCEEFKTEKDLIDGRCPEHPGTRLETVQEENYFFKLEHYADKLEKLIVSDELRIVPEIRKNEVLAFLRGGLEDLSISRSAKRAHGWGVPVPDDSEQMQYVWVDALSNYITALDYANDSERFKKYWEESNERIHVIGKGISRFHAIYWPAFLLSAGVQLPKTLFVHGYITVGGQKMSKSLGNIIDPFAIVKEYSVDAFRYFVARHVHPFEDSDFTMEKFKEAYNANLANGLGNFVSRVMKLSESYLNDTEMNSKLSFKSYSESSSSFQSYGKKLDAFNYPDAISMIWQQISAGDELMQEKKPFSLIKKDKTAAKETIQNLVQRVWRIAIMLEPVMPATSMQIQKAVKNNKKPKNLFPRKE